MEYREVYVEFRADGKEGAPKESIATEAKL